MESQERDDRLQHTACILARRDGCLHFRPASRENPRCESIQGLRRRGNRESIRRWVRGQGIPGHRPGHSGKEAQRGKSAGLAERVQRSGLFVPRGSRTAHSPLQGMADIPYPITTPSSRRRKAPCKNDFPLLTTDPPSFAILVAHSKDFFRARNLPLGPPTVEASHGFPVRHPPEVVSALQPLPRVALMLIVATRA